MTMRRPQTCSDCGERLFVERIGKTERRTCARCGYLEEASRTYFDVVVEASFYAEALRVKAAELGIVVVDDRVRGRIDGPALVGGKASRISAWMSKIPLEHRKHGWIRIEDLARFDLMSRRRSDQIFD